MAGACSAAAVATSSSLSDKPCLSSDAAESVDWGEPDAAGNGVGGVSGEVLALEGMSMARSTETGLGWVSNTKGKPATASTTNTDLTVYSPDSPLGNAILDAKIGETVEYTAPTGKKITVKIVAVKHFEG